MRVKSEGALAKARYAIVTGGSRGLGLELSAELIQRGIVVIVGCRNPPEGYARMAHRYSHLASKAQFVDLDLASIKSVECFASQILENYPPIDLLVNNAAVCNWRERRTVDGFEESVAVNYLAPFALTALLGLDPARAKNRMVLNVGTNLHDIDVLRLLYSEPIGDYDMSLSYRGSKMLLRAMTEEFNARYGGTGLQLHWINPGLMRTGLGAEGLLGTIGRALSYPFALDPRKAARRMIKLLEHATYGDADRVRQRPLPLRLKDPANRTAIWSQTLGMLSAQGLNLPRCAV